MAEAEDKARIRALEKLVQIFQDRSPLGGSPPAVAAAPAAAGLSPQAAKAAEVNNVLSQLSPANLKALRKSFVDKLVGGVESPPEVLTEAGVQAGAESIVEQERLGGLQEKLVRMQRIIVNTGDAGFSLEKLAAHDARVEALRKSIESGPLTPEVLDQKLSEINRIAEADGKGVVEQIRGQNIEKITVRNTEAMNDLVSAAGKNSSEELHKTVRDRFRAQVEAGVSVEKSVKEFSGLQKSIDIEARTSFQKARGFLSGQLGTEKGSQLIAEGKVAEGTKSIRGAKLKGRGVAGALAIPLLLALFRGGKEGGEGQPEELDLRQLFLQRQSQELAGSQAKLNSQLGLNDARRSKASAQAEGQLLRNLIMMQQVSGGGVSLP